MSSETGSASASGTANDTTAPSPAEVDCTKVHTFIFETATSDRNTKSLTDAGVEAIAAHKYKPGKYTVLDNLLNPVWAGLTELLPMWLAPNMVTFLGAMHCFVSYMVTWYYSPNWSGTPLPDWVIFLSGYCTIAYYTFDCMDGKQARRTGQSSPLGQLFDHGFDCLCNLNHVSTQAGYLLVGGSWWFFGMQGSLFFFFFMAQWEEYYTGELPHAMGNFGVTGACISCESCIKRVTRRSSKHQGEGDSCRLVILIPGTLFVLMFLFFSIAPTNKNICNSCQR